VKRLPEGKALDDAVDVEEFKMEETSVASREVRSLAPGAIFELNADEVAFPKPFSTMPPGRYEAQAVLDTGRSYSYSGREAEDWVSDVVTLDGWNPQDGREPELTLDRHPGGDWKRAAKVFAAKTLAKMEGARVEEMTSPSLSRFWGRPVAIKAWVILPPGYSHNGTAFPTAYWTHGFSGNLDSALMHGLDIADRMKSGRMPPMIWVMLDQSIPQGTHEFADSANNGPWGTALTSEFIPYLESKYRMDARPSGRFLNGHSSGGWAALQLQVNYPKIFGGAWATSPDSSDFHDFNGVDLYAPNANLYRRADGSAVPIMREKGKVMATMEEIGRLEPVIGPYGGQMTSFDWVFSPKGPDGAPLPMFDRESGRVDPGVVAYWRDHYDLSHLVEANWAERGPDLKGRIHVTVGTADTFYLDGAARRFEAVLARLGAEPHFTFLEGRSHFNVYAVGADPEGLFNQIGVEMYAVARPGTGWKRR
jgi:S-formylglutathione hydrolase FrmB